MLPLALAAVMAGCTGPSQPLSGKANDADPGAATSWLPGFDLTLRDCREGGGVTVYGLGEDRSGPTFPFARADTRAELGHPPLTSDFPTPRPVEGPTTGMWHMTLQCASYTWKGEERSNFVLGWIGVLVQPPPWDAAPPAARQFFVGDLSVGDPDVRAALHEGAGLHASQLVEARAEWLAPDLLHTLVDDADHGRFETHARMRMETRTDASLTRLWFYLHTGEAPGPDGKPEPHFRPVSLDLEDAGIAVHTVEGLGRFTHTRTQAHAWPGAFDNVGGLLWEGFDRAVRAGPSPDIAFNRTWVH
jgi:hypothetical protein